VSQLLTRSTVMQCLHQGLVQAATQNSRVRAAGDFVLRGTDTFTILGCVFTTPGGTPHPCVTVRWSSEATRSTVVGDAPLTESSIGQCLAADQAVQGVVSINGAQPRVTGT
jgi:hypothetical protein